MRASVGMGRSVTGVIAGQSGEVTPSTTVRGEAMGAHGRGSGHDFAGSNTSFVIGFLEARGSPALVDEVLRMAGETRTRQQLTDPAVWSSYSQLRRLLEAVNALAGGLGVLGEIGRYSLDAVRAPELVSSVHSLGSPDAVLADISIIVSGTAPVLEVDTEPRGPADWICRMRVGEGYEPFPELCGYIGGLLAQIPRVFGLARATVDEEACQCLGAPACVQRVRWSPSASGSHSEYAEFQGDLYKARLDALQRSVAELVSGQGLEELLPMIVGAAARAVQAPSYVLAIREPATGRRRVYSRGLTTRQAESRLRSIDAGTRRQPNLLVEHVMSDRADHGYLVAIRSRGGRFAPHEHTTLATYADLAAVALDSASALDEARRQAATATALLELSNSLVQVTTVADLADRLAQAVPLVIDCDRSAVTLVDELGATARTVAVFGFSPDDGKRILAREIGIRDTATGGAGPGVRDEATEPHANRLLRNHIGSSTATSMPIRFDDRLLGWITADVTDCADRLVARGVEEKLRGIASQAAVAIANAQFMDTMRHQALHDSLTGLPNRALVLDRIEEALVRCRRHGVEIALFFLDLDGFKEVNDGLGHDAGDELLCEAAERLHATLRKSDFLGRLGGDEFVVLIEGPCLVEGPGSVSARLLGAFAQPFHLARAARSATVSASIGVAIGDRASAQHLLRDADAALYASKVAGKNRVEQYGGASDAARRR
jgi:diguanylate cyclase (GGDEF)-like protein